MLVNRTLRHLKDSSKLRSELYFEEGPSTLTSSRVDAVVKAVAEIDDSEFRAYRGGRQNEIRTALVDAVYSIRAQYDASDLLKGVGGRVRTFREKYSETRNDLSALAKLVKNESVKSWATQ